MAAWKRANPVNFFLGRAESGHPRLLARDLLRCKIGTARPWYRKDLFSHYGCVNAIEFSAEGDLLVSGGDDRRVLLWKMHEIMEVRERPARPAVMNTEHGSNIFCLNLSSDNKNIFSAGNDETVIIHDVETGECVRCYMHEKPVYCISLNPSNDDIFCSASDDGRVLIYDVRKEPSEGEALILASSTGAYHGVMYNPTEPDLVATANAKTGLSLYDVRKPKQPLVQYGENRNESCMSVRFNQRGTHLLGLRRRREAVLYATVSAKPAAIFDNSGYYNSCTMKSCTFAGPDDDFVLSGSDDFNLYLWKVPYVDTDDFVAVTKAIYTLSGHRSIVNQVRYNSAYNLIASSGVEKIIKLWSPVEFPEQCEDPNKLILKQPRKMYTHDEYIRLVLQTGQFMSHDYSEQNTAEDPRMMAFFDSLVQREVDGWSSEEDGEKISSDKDSATNDSSDECTLFCMGFRKKLRRREMRNILRDNQSTTYDANSRMALLINRKRKTLRRSRRHMARRQAALLREAARSKSPSAANGWPNGSQPVAGPSSNGQRECECGTVLDDLEESSEEESPVRKMPKSVVHVVGAGAKGNGLSVDRGRDVRHMDSGVELNSSSGSSHHKSSTQHRSRSERKPNKREGRRRRDSTPSTDSSDSNC
ncbi:Hypothetical predicted protein [Cloeon dipterum]|uniref:DDB1- and CUL4-associated factor 5 n=1 Tax=Cloeon dipterum TaxID=197152 RepID=A0A8S1DHQ2_9INSE|nr:Hypothetical predicted protein [Cloeon dipterum]